MPRNTSGLRKGGGRTKGVPNKATREMKAIALSLTVGNRQYMANLRKRLLSGKIHPSVETFILAHAVGKPADKLDVTTHEMRPLIIDKVSTRAEMLAALGAGADLDAGNPDDDE